LPFNAKISLVNLKNMKKVIIAFIFVLGYAGAVSAATIGSDDGTTFNKRETKVLPAINIAAETNSDITAEHGIRLFMNWERQVLWDAVDTLSLSGSAVTNGKIPASVKPVYEDNYRTLYIPVTADFASGESVKISGVGLRVYDEWFLTEYIQLDINDDGISDATDINRIQVNDFYATDVTAPYPVTNFKAVLSGDLKSVSLSWQNPPDYDLLGCSLDRTRVRNSLSQQTSLVTDSYTTGYTDTDIQTGDTLTYSVFCSDGRNFSDKVEQVVEVKAATTGQPATQPTEETSGQPTDEITQLSNLFNYYKIRYSIKCMPSGVPALQNDSACLWARIDMVYAQEKLSRNEVNTTISDYDKQLMSKRVQYSEARYQTNCVGVSTPASYCPALEKALDRIYYFIGTAEE
jgi:hypothetical protein